MAQVNTKICARSYRPASMLEFFFVDVDGDICADEMLQAAGVVEVQMAKDDGLDVFDVIACRLDGGRQSLRIFVFSAREHVG